MPNLRKLNAHGNKIQRITGLDKCKFIEYIDLSNNALLDFSVYYSNLNLLLLLLLAFYQIIKSIITLQ